MLGNGATASIIAEKGQITLKKYYKYRRRQKNLNKEFGKIDTHLESLQQSCVGHMRPVRSPLALISQVQRSGGPSSASFLMAIRSWMPIRTN